MNHVAVVDDGGHASDDELSREQNLWRSYQHGVENY
jgi:hypothetical protein